MKRLIWIACLLLPITLAGTACGKGKSPSPPSAKAAATDEGPVRPAAWAGKFYPDDPEELRDVVDGMLKSSVVPKLTGVPIALVLPHAGYEYSGKVAAAGIKALEGQEIETAVIVGASHHRAFSGVNVREQGSLETPLGKVPVDPEIAAAISAATPLVHAGDDDAEEHSIEVELPFLQRALPGVKVVPLLIGEIPPDGAVALGKAIAAAVRGKNVILIASSDLSHYPRAQDAKAAEDRLLPAIASRSTATVKKTMQGLEAQQIPNAVTFACGIEAILAVMTAANELGAGTGVVLAHANSGEATGDKSRVVGYGAVAFLGERRGEELTRAEQLQLLAIARESVTAVVHGKGIPEVKPTSPALARKLGAFVTLKEHGRLRGCIGRFSPADAPLAEVVAQMAAAAATSDPRFPAVTTKELPELSYEISVLSDLTPVNNWRRIRVGKDGVQLSRGFHRGVFLPQVATEQGWDLTTFLGELCMQKAGLPADCYLDPKTDLQTFTAQVFGEKE